jgi:hypothetical protein
MIRKIFTATLLLCLSSLSTAQTAQVVSGIIDYSAMVQFAKWSWEQRAGFDIDWGGSISALSYADCTTATTITVRTTAGASEANPEFRFVSNPTTIAQTAECTNGAGTANRMFVTGFNPGFPLPAQYLRKSVLHEVGHMLGAVGHHSNVYGVLFATDSILKSDYLLTTSDVELVLSSPAWSTYASPSYCHNELASDNDLMIPEVVLGGTRTRALLNYVGVVGGYHTWGVNYTSDSPSPKNCSNNSQDGSGNITLTDVRGMSGSYASATLQPYGGQWRLIGFTL